MNTYEKQFEELNEKINELSKLIGKDSDSIELLEKKISNDKRKLQNKAKQLQALCDEGRKVSKLLSKRMDSLWNECVYEEILKD